MTATLLRKYREGPQNYYNHFNTYERLSMLYLPNLQYCLYCWPQQEFFIIYTSYTRTKGCCSFSTIHGINYPMNLFKTQSDLLYKLSNRAHTILNLLENPLKPSKKCPFILLFFILLS